jgi:ABC-type nickel/cobalt efflux system permease component RcnA
MHASLVNLWSIVMLGFFLGMRHATDPDHVIAVSTIVSRQRSTTGAVLIGALWGLGHTITIVVVGGVIIAFEVVIPPRVGLSMEFSVALMLILLGVLNLTGFLQRIGDTVHSHAHQHGELVHAHMHHHDHPAHAHTGSEAASGWLDDVVARLGVFGSLRPLLVGIVHGLAGSAAIALLVLTAIPSQVWAIAYLLVFGVGTMAGMMLITAAHAVPVTLTARRFARTNRFLRVASGVVSAGFGLFLAYHIGVVDGLFTSRPVWTPG